LARFFIYPEVLQILHLLKRGDDIFALAARTHQPDWEMIFLDDGRLNIEKVVAVDVRGGLDLNDVLAALKQRITR